MMICYKFPNKETFLSLSLDKVVHYTHDYSINEIGSVVITEGTYGEEGNELTAPVMDNGHHVNYQGAPPLDWEEYRIRYVETPVNVFAGVLAETAP